MKKNIVLFVIFILAFSSCSKSEDNVITQSSIVGKWQLVSSSDGNLSSCNIINASFQFNANNTAIETDGHLSGNDCVKSTYNETYTLNDNILVIKELNSSGTVISEYTYTVTALTSSTLKLKYASSNNAIWTYSKVN